MLMDDKETKYEYNKILFITLEQQLCGFEILETITLRFESGAGLKLVDTSVHSTRYAFSGVTNNVE